MQALIEFPTAKITPIKGHFMESGRDIETLKEFHRVLRRSLRPPVYSVFCAIEDHAGTTPPPGLPPFTCFASDKTLADEASVSRETVIRAIKELEGLKLITVEDRQGYTCLIWPLVTNQGYLTYMKEQAGRVCQKATCNTEPQGVCQKATGGVSESHTNETKLTNQINETNKDMFVSGETTTPADSQGVNSFEPTDPTPSSRQVEVMAAVPVSSNGQARPGADGQAKPKIHIPPVPKPVPKAKKEPDPTLLDERLLMWRKYADLAEYGPWPNLLQRQMIIDTVPFGRLDRWETYLKYWVAHGWQMRNVEDQLELFVTGKPPKIKRGI